MADETEGPAPEEEAGTPEGEDEATPTREALEARLAEAGARAAELEERLAKFTDTLARVQADYENFRKRAKRERDEVAAEAQVPLVRALADVLDDLVRARGQGEADDPVVQGLSMVERRVATALSDLGVVELRPGAGDVVDPSVHEVVMTEATEGVPPGTVVATLQPGYLLGDRLVRAARVKAATAPQGDEA